MGITFAYELGLKSFLYEISSTRKVTSKFNWGNPVKHFQNPQKPNRKKVTGLLRSGGKKIHQISFFLFFVKSGQTMVKLIIQEY